MKKLFSSLFFSAVGICAQAQNNVGINTTTPDASAVLDITSTTQGILVPRMDSTQRAGISSPATGLLVYQTNGTTPGFYYFNGAGWTAIGGGTPSQLEKITQSGKTGYRLYGANAANYGVIGTNAIDLSISNTASTTSGARGTTSFATGQNTTASGSRSTAMGNGSLASGSTSTAMGAATTASGSTSTAMGSGTSASGVNATAMGNSSDASGDYSTAMGISTIAAGNASTAMGNGAAALSLG